MRHISSGHSGLQTYKVVILERLYCTAQYIYSLDALMKHAKHVLTATRRRSPLTSTLAQSRAKYIVSGHHEIVWTSVI